MKARKLVEATCISTRSVDACLQAPVAMQKSTLIGGLFVPQYCTEFNFTNVQNFRTALNPPDDPQHAQTTLDQSHIPLRNLEARVLFTTSTSSTSCSAYQKKKLISRCLQTHQHLHNKAHKLGNRLYSKHHRCPSILNILSLHLIVTSLSISDLASDMPSTMP